MGWLAEVAQVLNSPWAAGLLFLLVAYLWLGRKFAAIHRVLLVLQSVVCGQMGHSKIVLEALKKKILTPDDWRRIAESKDNIIQDLFKQEAEGGNPLSPVDLGRVRGLYDKIKLGEALSLPEAREFDVLVTKLETERPDHTGTWVLAGLAGLALGFLLGAALSSDDD